MMIIDLTHLFVDKMIAYPGDEAGLLNRVNMVNKDGFSNYMLKTGVHVGTHIDGPQHMLEKGKALHEIHISRFISKGILIDVRGKKIIDSSVLKDRIIEGGDTILFYSNFSSFLGQKRYFEEHPVLTDDLAEAIVDLGSSMIGLDWPSPDRHPFLIHKKLLENDVLIIENLTNLSHLINKRFRVVALPMFLDSDSAPARVVAELI